MNNLEQVKYRVCLLTFGLEKLCIPNGHKAMLLCTS